MSNANTPAAEEPKAKGNFVSTLLAGVLSSTIAAGSVLAAGVWLLHSGRLVAAPSPGKAAAKPAEIPAEAVEKRELPPSKVVPLEPMVVNLSDAGGRAYLRASISLRMVEEPLAKGEKAEKPEGKADPSGAAGKTAALRDTTLSVLGAQTSDSLLNAEGVTAVKKRLRERYALDNPEVHVLEVYFTDFLVQRG